MNPRPFTPRELEILQLSKKLHEKFAKANTPQKQREVLLEWNQAFGEDPGKASLRYIAYETIRRN